MKSSNTSKPIVSEEYCKNCIVFQTSKFKNNMIKYNICHKRDMTGC